MPSVQPAIPDACEGLKPALSACFVSCRYEACSLVFTGETPHRCEEGCSVLGGIAPERPSREASLNGQDHCRDRRQRRQQACAWQDMDRQDIRAA